MRALAHLGAAAVLGLLACGGAPARRGPLPPLPRDGYAHYLAGRLALVDGDAEQAVREFGLAALAAPDQPDIVVALVGAQLRARALADADRTTRAAIDRWPESAAIWRARGDVARARDQLPAATAAYERAIELRPLDEAAYLALASTWIARVQPEQADAALARLVRAVPSSIEGNWRLARAAIDRARPADAEPYLRAVLDAEPDHLDARLELAAVLRARGDVGGAVTQSRQAFDRSGQHPEIGEALVWMLCEHGDRQAALDVLALLEDEEAVPATLLRLAWIRITLGELPAAERAALAAERKARAARDEDTQALAAEAVLARATALRARGADGAAIEALGPLAPTDADAAALLSAMLLTGGDVDDAVATATASSAAHPDHAELALALALARHAHGDGAASSAALRRAVTQRPDDRALALAWTRFLDETGASDAALAWLEQAAPRWPTAASVQNQLGYLLVQRGRPDDLARALPLLARARALAPGDPTVLDSWGLLRLRQGQHALAARALGRAAALAPHEPEILLHVAELNAARGELARATAMARRALALPGPPRLRARLDALLATWTAASPG